MALMLVRAWSKILADRRYNHSAKKGSLPLYLEITDKLSFGNDYDMHYNECVFKIQVFFRQQSLCVVTSIIFFILSCTKRFKKLLFVDVR